MSLKFLDLGELHNCGPDIAQAVGGQVGAGDVLHEGTEVDARILLGESVGGYKRPVSNYNLCYRYGESYVGSG